MSFKPFPHPLRALLAAGLLAAIGAEPAPAADAKGVNLRLEVARQLEEKGEYDKAAQELRLYLSEHPEEAPALYARIGGLRLKQGNYKLAGENFKIALAKDPASAEARAGLAQAYEKQGEKAKAEEERRKLAEPGKNPAQESREPGAPNPPNPPAAPARKPAGADSPSAPSPTGGADPARPGPAPREARGAAATAPAGEAGFSPALDSASSRGPEGIYADKDFQAALELYKAGKLDAMAGPLRRCISRHPGHPGAYYLGGVMRYERGDFAKALYNFKRALAYPDRGFNAHFYMGRIYQRQERFPEAAAEYREYLKATQSPAGRKQAEGFLAQMGEGNPSATPYGAPPRKVAGEKPPAATGAAGHGLKEASAKEAAREAGPGPTEASGSGTAGSHAAPAAKSAPVPPSEAKALVMGRDGSFFFLVPDPASASGRKMREAHSLVDAERFEKAAEALKEVMLGYGGSDNARAAGLDLASVYLQLGLWEQARERAADVVDAPAGDSAKYRDAALYLSALACLGLKDGEKAEKALLKIRPGAPDGPVPEEVGYRLAQAGALLNDPKKYSGYLERGYAGTKDPVRKAGYARDMGGLHAKFGALDKAQGWYGKAAAECQDTRKGPGPGREAMGKDSVLEALCAEVKLRMADLAYRKKDWKGAMAGYRQFATQWPGHKESAWVHYQMANIHKVAGNFESALNEYKRVIDNYPDSYWASQAKWKREDAIWRKEYEEVLD